MFAMILKTLIGTTSLNGTKIDGGFLSSHRVLALLSVPIFMMLNNKLGLGVTEEQFKWYMGLVAAYVLGKTAEDSVKRSAAIKADATVVSETVTPAPPTP